MIPYVYYFEKIDDSSNLDVQFCFLANSVDDAMKYLYQEYCEHPRNMLLFREYDFMQCGVASADSCMVMSAEDMFKKFSQWNFEIADFCKKVESSVKDGVH